VAVTATINDRFRVVSARLRRRDSSFEGYRGEVRILAPIGIPA
jgi:hypothetical protein